MREIYSTIKLKTIDEAQEKLNRHNKKMTDSGALPPEMDSIQTNWKKRDEKKQNIRKLFSVNNQNGVDNMGILAYEGHYLYDLNNQNFSIFRVGPGAKLN